MVSLYVPTIDHSLWPFAVLLVVFVPLSLWHEHNWRAMLAVYADARRGAGASDERWPSSETSWMLSLQPWLLLAVAGMLAAMVALGTAAMAVWPHKLPGFDLALNPYDRPYLAAMLVVGTAAVVGVVALALDLRSSPWSGVANEVRRCVYTSPEERETRFERALECDPGVPHAEQPSRPSDSEHLGSVGAIAE